MRPVNQLPLSEIAMKRSPLASSLIPDSPPKPRKDEVRINPLRYCSEPNRVRARSRVSNDAIGRALTSIATGVSTENSSGLIGFGGGCTAVCADATAGTAAVESPAAAKFRKRRRLRCLILMVRRRVCAVSNHEARLPRPSRRGEDAAPQDEAFGVFAVSSHRLGMQSARPTGRGRRGALGLAEQFGELFGDGAAEFLGIDDGHRAAVIARHVMT